MTNMKQKIILPTETDYKVQCTNKYEIQVAIIDWNEPNVTYIKLDMRTEQLAIGYSILIK